MTAVVSTAATVEAAEKPKPKGALDPQDFKPFKVLDKEKLTPNTYRIRFELPKDLTSGLTVASCLVTRAVLPDKEKPGESKAVVTPYTPTSPPDVKGHMDLIVKSYPNGRMSKHICSLKPGDTLEIKGPIPKLPITPNLKKNIGMVAGGTGITPMLQVIDAVLSNPDDTTKLSLVYANQTPRDIILKSRLDELAAKHPDRFTVYYLVDRTGWLGRFTWRGGRGFITQDVLKQHLPPPDKDNLILVCGPPAMMQAISGPKAKDYSQGEVAGALKELGYTSTQVFKF